MKLAILSRNSKLAAEKTAYLANVNIVPAADSANN